MRSSQDKELIRSNLITPFSVKNILTKKEITSFIDYYNQSSNKIKKNTGPITLNINLEEFESNKFKFLIDRLSKFIGQNWKIYSAFFFYTDIPHIIHNDDSYDFPLIYRAITIPLQIFAGEDYQNLFPSLCFFDQYYLDGPSKFFFGSKDIPTFYNKCVYDYNDVINRDYSGINEVERLEYLSHLKKSWINGLTLNSIIDWIPGDAIIFDNCRLHCASNFKKQNIHAKLGLSIFTYHYQQNHQ